MKPNNTLSMLLILTAGAGLTFAAPEKQTETDKDLLRGPSVVDSGNKARNQLTRAMDTRSPEELTDDEINELIKESPITMRELTTAMRHFAKDRLELTPEQDERIKAILSTYREELRLFQQEHAAEIQALRAEMNKHAVKMREAQKKAKESGTEPPAPSQSKAAIKLREMIAQSPPAKSAIKKLRAVLDEKQTIVLHRAIIAYRMDIEKKRSRAGDAEGRSVRREMNSDGMNPTNQRRNRNQKIDRSSNRDKDD